MEKECMQQWSVNKRMCMSTHPKVNVLLMTTPDSYTITATVT